MHVQIAGQFLRVDHLARAVRGFHQAPVAGLTAAFAIEGGGVRHHLDGLAGFDVVHRLAVLDDGRDVARGFQMGVAGKVGRAEPIAQGEPHGALRLLPRTGPAFARHGALALHRFVEAGQIDADAARAYRVLRQIKREAVGVVEFERRFAREGVAVAKVGGRFVQQAEPAAERAVEPFFLAAQGFDDGRRRAAQIGIGFAHFADEGGHEAMHQRLGRAQQIGVAHGPAHDPAQHIAAPFVRGRHAVGDQEAGGTQMVGDHPVRRRRFAVGLDAGGVFAGCDQGFKEIGVEHAGHALEHGGRALQTHAGIDAGLGQVGARAVGALVELHEHQVPDLHEPVAVFVRRAGRSAGDAVAVVVEDFRARPARTGIAHRPEVVGGVDADDAIVGETSDLAPQARRLFVGGVDGDQQPGSIQSETVGDQFPRQFDGQRFEVVAEGEIPQHFEEGQVPGGVADVVQIVVLAAGAHAFLRRGRARRRTGFGAGEDVLERHHAGVDEHQGRIALRHQRRRRDHQVIGGGEIVEKLGADIIETGHDARSSR